MQKLKYSLVEKLIAAKVTNMELLFIISIGQFQNERGEVIGVYYRKICDMMNCSVQTYYNVLRSLQEKRIIEVTKKTESDCDILIQDNSFEDGNFKCGYVSLRRIMFRTTLFAKSKVNEKLMLMDLLMVLSSNRGRWQVNKHWLYQRYQSMLGVSRHTVRRYLNTIRRCMEQIVKVSRNGDVYTFVLQLGGERNAREESDELKVNENVVECIFRRIGIRRARTDDIIQLAKLIRQYTRLATEAGKNIFRAMADSVRKYIEWANRYLLPKEKKDYTINLPMLHKKLREEIGLNPAAAI